MNRAPFYHDPSAEEKLADSENGQSRVCPSPLGKVGLLTGAAQKHCFESGVSSVLFQSPWGGISHSAELIGHISEESIESRNLRLIYTS